ncbi:S1 family peptidase [Tengunoibacter tsumagoiensis]|uniref:Peptidase S1 domain-containing protein n=1 Tax=Tengunoibacter tsumagoiensis TaxID=2014871 RepID=A0A402A5F1_9CHLR|nr:serine protease [Tengunoibacter tsumagoiensis]GCE14367.1 hypothetical protein KTT_42260 [Tengunoibacter tsumagoiensis]
MNRKYRSSFFSLSHPSILISGILAVLVALVQLTFTQSASADPVPGGNVANPIVKAVDLAKPSVVRIITTEQATLTVHFPTADNKTVTFPQGGGQYALELSGSGTFITAHGDILTADHVINPPKDQSLDQYLQQLAAQDVADYINQQLNPSVDWSKEDAAGALSSGYLLSTAKYNTPSSKVYLSTDYTGPINAVSMKSVPTGVSAEVDKIEKESSFEQKDVAIIHVNIENTPNIQLSDSSLVAQQDELTIIGFPGNGDVSMKDLPTTFLTSSVNRIYVSAIKKTDEAAPVIQVGGNVEHGDSGGPALNSQGQIVGVVSFGGTDMPDGTSFLQASNSAKELIDSLNLDTKPGELEKAWIKAFNDYTSTATGHWHKSSDSFQKILDTYPDFHAVSPYIDYARAQASTEKLPQKPSAPATPFILTAISFILIALLVLAVIAVALFFILRRKGPNTAIASSAQGIYQPSQGQAPSYQPYATPAPQQPYQQTAPTPVGAASYAQVGSQQPVGAYARPLQGPPQGEYATPAPQQPAVPRPYQPPLQQQPAVPRPYQPLQQQPVQPYPNANLPLQSSGQIPVVPTQPQPWPPVPAQAQQPYQEYHKSSATVGAPISTSEQQPTERSVSPQPERPAQIDEPQSLSAEATLLNRDIARARAAEALRGLSSTEPQSAEEPTYPHSDNVEGE